MMYDSIEFTLAQKIILWGIPLLFAITLHEVAHGWVASKLGDPTAKLLGRLSLNPLKHVDPVGTVLLPALTSLLGGFVFGWAKPVPITWRNLKHGRRDIVLVAFAGPFANLLMAILWALVARFGQYLEMQQMISGVVFEAMGKIGMYVNCLLCLFNLLPLPPLDGGRIVSNLLTNKLAYYFDKLENYGLIILLLLFSTKLLAYFLTLPLVFLVTTISSLFGVT